MIPRIGAHGGKAARAVKRLYRQNAAFSKGYGPIFSLDAKRKSKNFSKKLLQFAFYSL
jgi:hypothetical protein